MTTPRHSKVSSARLDDAYRATGYVVRLPEGPLTLRIDVRSPELASLLADLGQPTWAFISASNPGSRPLDDAENTSRHRQLVARVMALGLRHFEGAGVPDRPGWNPEPGLLILGVSRGQAHALAAEFGQNALLFGEGDAIPRLQYVLSAR